MWPEQAISSSKPVSVRKIGIISPILSTSRVDNRIKWDYRCEGVFRCNLDSLKFKPIKSAMLSNHLIVCCPYTPSWITALSWRRGLHGSMKLWTTLCRTTQDRQVVVKSADKTWSTGGNGKPLQYSCLENPMNSMKRQAMELPWTQVSPLRYKGLAHKTR